MGRKHAVQYTIPPGIRTLAERVRDAGATLYIVGGLPRNAHLSLPPSDIDTCSKLLPEDILQLCDAANYRYVPKGLAYGTVEIHLPDGTITEHTTFRNDRYGDGGTHRPEAVVFSSSLEEDAFRRDFTCNALYLDALTLELKDPSGGVKDIERRVIRATNKVPHTVLQDDGLRIMRLVRFACELGFDVEKKTWAAAQECVAGLADIAWERKRDELVKILLSDIRYPSLTEGLPSSILRGLFMLYELKALAYIVPELLEGDGVQQRAQYHAHDVMRHNFYACAYSEPTLTLRLAGLLHDVGKPAALREKGLPLTTGGSDPALRTALSKGDTPMLGHDILGRGIAEEMLLRLRFPKKIIEDVLFLIENHMYDLNGRAKESTLRARFALMGYSRAQMLCAIREADVLGSGKCSAFSMQSWRDLLARMKAEGAPFSLKELHCTGDDIMEWYALPPGEKVGEILERLWKHCARHPQDNTPPRLQTIGKGLLK